MMKLNRWRMLSAAIAAMVLMTACGLQEEPETVEVNEVKERIEEPEIEEDTEPVTEPEEIEDPEEELEEEPAEWVAAYKEFLSDGENMVPLLLEEGEGGKRGYITGFYLHDLNGDEVPELFLQKDYVADYIYTYVDSHMELRNVIAYDDFGESYFGFDARDGQAYCFELDAGTGTDRSTSMSRVTLIEISHDMEKTVGAFNTDDDGMERICSALFGGIEQADGTYLDLKWEDVVFANEQFKDLALYFVPFDYHEVTDENIETYITMAYADMAANCSLQSYRKKMEDKREAFQNAGLFCEIKDGEYMIPDTVTRIEEVTGIIYYDTDRLACFREEDLLPKLEGDWKQIYREWLKTVDTLTGNNGDPVLTDSYDSGITFYDWERTEEPVLLTENGIFPWTRNYFAILDGEVVNIGAEAKLAMGASIGHLINENDYYLRCYQYGPAMDIYCGELFQINHEGAKLIGVIEWQQVYEYQYEEPGEDYVPEYTYDNPNCQLYGEQMSKQEFMSEIDKLLGEGAAAQVVAIVDNCGNLDGIEGPLTFAEPLIRCYYTRDQMMKMLDAP